MTGVAIRKGQERAQAPGFRSDVVNLVSRNPMDNPDIGLIVLHRMGNVEGTSVSATSLLAALLQNNVALAYCTAPLVGCLLGFLRFNFNPATSADTRINVRRNPNHVRVFLSRRRLSS